MHVLFYSQPPLAGLSEEDGSMKSFSSVKPLGGIQRSVFMPYITSLLEEVLAACVHHATTVRVGEGQAMLAHGVLRETQAEVAIQDLVVQDCETEVGLHLSQSNGDNVT